MVAGAGSHALAGRMRSSESASRRVVHFYPGHLLLDRLGSGVESRLRQRRSSRQSNGMCRPPTWFPGRVRSSGQLRRNLTGLCRWLTHPFNVFGRTDDAKGIARTIASALEGSELRREGAGFRITVPAKRRASAVTVNVDPGYFEGELGLRQKLGLATYLGTKLGGTGLDEALSMVRELRMAVAIMADAPIQSTAGDELFRLAFKVAAAADGFVIDLGEGCVWSADGRLLASTLAAASDDDEAVEDCDPPHMDRVAMRTVALVAVAARALCDDLDGAGDTRSTILAWVEGLGAMPEFETDERRIIETPASALPSADRVNGSWRVEGAAVLAWALGLIDLPAHDEPIDPGDLITALGEFDAERTVGVLAGATLRPPEELQLLAARQLAVHWRLREQSVRPEAIDFAELARTAWFGPLEITGLRLVDGDLAVDGRTLSDADPALVQRTISTVAERHLAANWLLDGGIYSDTDTST